MAEPLTPHDTGEVAEPSIWPNRGDLEDIGKVDFDDDESATVVTIRVARNDSGCYVVHVEPHQDDVTVVVHES